MAKPTTIKLYTVLFLLLAACNASFLDKESSKGAVNWAETPFVFDDCKMYYQGKEFELGWHIRDYEKVFGKGYRRVDPVGSYGYDNVFTFDSVGIMMLGTSFGNAAQSDTIKQINIVFNYEYSELHPEWEEAKNLTDKMQLPENYARPKHFYNQKLLLNGTELQFGTQGLTVTQANNKLRTAPNSPRFEKKALAYTRFYFPNCAQKIKVGQVFSTASMNDKGMVDEFHIGADFWNEN